MSSNDVADNPFQLVYNSLWNCLESDSRFTTVVEKKNRISFGRRSSRDVLKLTASSADFPELMLVSQGITDINLHDTSTTSMLIRQYAWVIVAGDYRTHEIFPVEWAVFAAMNNWKDKIATLSWNDKNFVKAVNFTDVEFGQSEEQFRKRINGWTSIWSVDVRMHFDQKDLMG